MTKKKVIGVMMGVMMTFTCLVVPSSASAVESQLLDNDENIKVVYDVDAEIKQLEPVEIDSFQVESQVLTNVSLTIEDKIKESESTQLKVGTARNTRAVQNGSVSDYLSGTGDAKVYSITINPLILLQAKLVQPNNSGIDYDLYIFDSTGTTILDASENYTYMNSDGTLDESVGIINQGSEAETYYLFVNSSQGGSINEAFTLEYAISYPYDNFETDEHPSIAKNFTYGITGAYINSRSISSPIDSDWYVINVPSTRSYDKINFNILTSSSNACKVEVYKDMSNGSFQMKKLLSNGGNLSISTGKYYIKVSYSGSNFNQDDVQNYTLDLTPILTPQSIVITGYNSDMGPNDYPSGYYYGKHYRAKGFLDIAGYVTTTDAETGIVYGIPYTSVTGKYINEGWSGTAANNIRTGTSTTDSTGKFVINITLPPSAGSISQYITVSTHYYDYCGVLAYVTSNSSIQAQDFIYHYGYAIK